MASNKEAVVRRMVDALQRADANAIGELLSDDVVYRFPGRSPVAGTYRGRAEVLGLFATFRQMLDGPPRFDTHDVVASEAHVVELSSYEASRGGRTLRWNVMRTYHVGEDRIAEIWLAIDDLYAFDDFLE
jgi:ketosteroid isomerase-like protein